MHCLSPFSNVGTTFGFFHSDGNLPERKQFWKIILSSLHMEMLQSFVMRMLIMSWPWALVGSRLFRTSLNRDSNTDVFLICEIFENNFFYRTPPVGSSGISVGHNRRFQTCLMLLFLNRILYPISILAWRELKSIHNIDPYVIEGPDGPVEYCDLPEDIFS